MNLKSLSASLLLLSAMSASAVDLVDGGVYRITNNDNHLVIQAPETPGGITANTADESNPRQLWVAYLNSDGTGYYLRDLAHGTYMTTPLQKSQRWVTTLTTEPIDDTMSFIINDELSNTSIQAVGYDPVNDAPGFQKGYAHANGGNGTNLICWGNGANASRWTLTPIDMDTPTLNHYKAAWQPLQIYPNCVYQFVTTGREAGGRAISAANGTGNVTCVAPNASNKAQLWVAEENPDGSGIYMRNLISGLYLNSPMQTNAFWICSGYNSPSAQLDIEQVEGSNKFTIIPISADHSDNSKLYAHEDDQHRLFSWGKSAGASQWTINFISTYDNAAVEAEKANWTGLPLTNLTDGKVYRLVNVGYPGRSLSHADNSNLVSTATDQSSLRQLWIAEANEEGTGFVLRNYETGSAISSAMSKSGQWKVVNSSKLDPSKTVLYTTVCANGVAFRPLSVKNQTGEAANYGYMHNDGSHNAVGWSTDAAATRWVINCLDEYTPEMIEAQRQTWAYTKQDNLEATLATLFADKTCTELNADYQAMSIDDIMQDANYLALPETLRQMVLKVHTGDWSETDPTNAAIEWDSYHAKKFRVQMVEPYSNCDGITNMTCIQAYTNFNNPTGILSDNGTTLYVMVEKGAAPGSTLYIAPRTFASNVNKLNVVNDGTELHEGLNIVHCDEDCAEMVVYYTVATNQGRTRVHPLTDYDNIKIHVEGGSINGFFNAAGDALYTPDTNEDWFYYRERARHPRFSLISKHCLLYMHFHDATDDNGNNHSGLKNLLTRAEYEAGNFDLNHTMSAWDDMFVAEMLVMGLVSDDVIRAEKEAGRDWYDPLEGDDIAPNDYSLYFNNRLMGISSTSGFMSATWYRTTYHINTLRSVIMQFPTMDLWGPAHEFGHLNQGPMKIAGTSEESNNVFSNIALFYRGKNTSRASLPSVQQDFFNKGYNFHQHDTWGTTRMWFQLWLYYHAAGYNKKFYPRLYELLRENPLQKNSTTHLNAKDDLLHFAKMCCIAAQEDLTDFFEAWGFFVEQDGYYIGDYTSYTAYLSAEDIAEWKAEVKEMAEENGWKKNNAIIFIDDRVGSTKAAYADWCRPADAGDMGGLQDYIDHKDAVTGDYEFTVSGTTVSVSGGEGGVGFLIYDEDGKLIGFANTTTFEVSPETAQKLAAGEATFTVMQSNNEEIPVIDTVREGDLESRLAAIADLLATAENLLAYSDPTDTKVGYLKPEVVSDLLAAYNDVKEKYDNGEITEENATELFENLSAEVLAISTLKPTSENTVNIVPNNIYAFTVNRSKGKYGVRPSDNRNTVTPVPVIANVNKNVELQQWFFIPAETEGSYYLQNVECHKYLRLADSDGTALRLTDEPEQSWTVQPKSLKFVAIVANSTEEHNAIHADGNGRIVRWGADNEASQWTLELIDDSESKSLIFALSDIIAKAEALLPQAGTVETAVTATDPIELTPDDLFTNAPCQAGDANNVDRFNENTWSYLFDDNSQTIFHSDYSGTNSTDGLNHYIRIKIPENTDFFTHFILGYRTRYNKGNNTQVNSPTDVTIACSPDGTAWTEVNHTTSGLTTSFATDQTLAPCSLPVNAQYIRFMVNHAQPDTQKGGHTIFAISELRLWKATVEATDATPAEQFTFVEPEMMINTFNDLEAAKSALNNPDATAEQRTEALQALTDSHDTLLTAMNRNIERLRELIAETRALAEELGENAESTNPLSTSVDQYSTNAEYTGTNTNDHLSSWSVLFDNQAGTYFHSTYDSQTTDNGDHYIQIRLNEPTSADETDMLLTYTTRNHSSTTYAPLEAVIQYSADGENWTVAHELSNQLPLTHNTQFESETFSVPAGTQFVRFTVTKSQVAANDTRNGVSNGHAYFSVSEFVLCEYAVTSKPKTEAYPDANAEALQAAIRQLHNSEVVVNAPRTNHADFDASYAALLPHYQTLLAIKNNPAKPTLIEEIDADDTETVIYTLQGVRISRITTPGVYIVNGKKIIAK